MIQPSAAVRTLEIAFWDIGTRSRARIARRSCTLRSQANYRRHYRLGGSFRSDRSTNSGGRSSRRSGRFRRTGAADVSARANVHIRIEVRIGRTSVWCFNEPFACARTEEVRLTVCIVRIRIPPRLRALESYGRSFYGFRSHLANVGSGTRFGRRIKGGPRTAVGTLGDEVPSRLTGLLLVKI